MAAGVPTRLTVTGGTTHAADIFAGVVPDIALVNARRIVEFARSL